MKKVASLFVLAVFAPSLVLAWLAIRSVQNQAYVLERQESQLVKGASDRLAREIADRVGQQQRTFADKVEAMVATVSAREIASSFDRELRRAWPLAKVGFVVSMNGELLAPSMIADSDARQFRLENEKFLTQRETVEVYWESPKGPINLSQLDRPPPMDKSGKSVFATKMGKLPTKDAPTVPVEQQAPGGVAEFRQLIGDSMEGTLARFLQDKLNLLLWYRSPRDPDLVFGAQLNLPRLVREIAGAMRIEPELTGSIAMALLDDTGKTVAVAPVGFESTGHSPFVVSDVVEALPHWQIAAYRLDADRADRSAEAVRLTLGLLIAVLLVAIAGGSWLIVRDLRRQLALARQKTDFVSNVSHELKTPLTSIRMFSELLAEGRVAELSKQRQYLDIVAAEAARLTRLIDNVLDFARTERGERRYRFEHFDLREIVEETLKANAPHLEREGFTVEVRLPKKTVPIHGDRDALAQVLVNLLSNAEKYSAAGKEVTVELEQHPDGWVGLSVLDRGAGVPTGYEDAIFEQFTRAHDSLSSGIQGSGLGLTLARQIARAHGGDVTYQLRPGGGSCFTLRLPLTRD